MIEKCWHNQTNRPDSRRSGSVRASVILGLILGLGGTRAEPMLTEPRPSMQQPEAAMGAGETVAPSGDFDYVLQRGDEISIKIFNLPELDETLKIRPDGRISAVLLDDVDAAGLTTDQLDALLTELYSQFYRDPQVTVIVRDFANLKVYVGGEVANPGPLDLTGKLTALWAVLQAGGFRNTARTDSVILLRKGNNDVTMVSKLNLKEVMNKGTPDVVLRPFDVVYVPMSRIAKVNKFVDQYMVQLLPITLTGGFTYLLSERIVTVPVP
jgi:polysaccharide export outer membrane protein